MTCIYIPLSFFNSYLLWLRCSDDSHQLVWNAVSKDPRQRVPQSGKSAAWVSARVTKVFLRTCNTQHSHHPTHSVVQSSQLFQTFPEWTTRELSFSVLSKVFFFPANCVKQEQQKTKSLNSRHFLKYHTAVEKYCSVTLYYCWVLQILG